MKREKKLIMFIFVIMFSVFFVNKTDVYARSNYLIEAYEISSFKITDGTFSYVNDSITSVDDISIKDTHFKKKNIDAVNSCD